MYCALIPFVASQQKKTMKTTAYQTAAWNETTNLCVCVANVLDSEPYLLQLKWILKKKKK